MPVGEAFFRAVDLIDALVTTKSLVLIHDRGFEFADPLELNYNLEPRGRCCSI